MNIITNYAPIPAISWATPEPIYGVIIHNSKTQSNHIISFKLTTCVREICEYVNCCPEQYHFKAFSTVYEAEIYIRSQLSFEEQFVFHLADGERVAIGCFYITEGIT